MNTGYIPQRDLRFTISRTIAPTLEVVTLDEARLQLRVDTTGSPPSNPEDSLIQRCINTAVAELDAGTGWLARALAPQTWRLGLDRFPSGQYYYSGNPASDAILLPYPPFISITSFTYTDSDGNIVTMVEGTDYRVIAETGETAEPAKVLPIYGANWPNARCDVDSIVITYRAGYVEGSPETLNVPDIIKNVILSRVTDLYDSRGVSAQGMLSEVPDHILNSLEMFRVRRVYP